MEDPLPQPSYGTDCREALIIGQLKDSLLSQLVACNPSISINSNHGFFIECRIQELFTSFHTPSHPPYALMIQRAIMELNEETGSTKEAISVFIQREYEDLPWAHVGILEHHLGKLCQEGELLCTENERYMVMADDGEETKCKSIKKRKKGRRKRKNGGRERNRTLESGEQDQNEGRETKCIEGDNGLQEQEANEQIQVSELNGVGTNDPSSVVELERQDEQTHEHGEAHQQLTERIEEQGKSDKQVLRVVDLEQQCPSNWRGTRVTEEHNEAENNQGRIAEAEEPQTQEAVIEMNDKIVSSKVFNKEPYQTDVEQGLIFGRDIHYGKKQQVLEDYYHGDEQQNGIHHELNELCGQQADVILEHYNESLSEKQNGEKQKHFADHYGEEQRNGVNDGLTQFCGQQTEDIQEHNNEVLLESHTDIQQIEIITEGSGFGSGEKTADDNVSASLGGSTFAAVREGNLQIFEQEEAVLSSLQPTPNLPVDISFRSEEQLVVPTSEGSTECILSSDVETSPAELQLRPLSGINLGTKLKMGTSLSSVNVYELRQPHWNQESAKRKLSENSTSEELDQPPLKSQCRGRPPKPKTVTDYLGEPLLPSDDGIHNEQKANIIKIQQQQLPEPHVRHSSRGRAPKHRNSHQCKEQLQPQDQAQGVVGSPHLEPTGTIYSSESTSLHLPISPTLKFGPQLLVNKMEKKQQHIRIRGRGRGRPCKSNQNANQSEENLQLQDPGHGLVSPQNPGQHNNPSLEDMQLQSQSQVQSQEGCPKFEPAVDKSSQEGCSNQKHQLLTQVKKRGRGRPPKTSAQAKQTQWQRLPTFQGCLERPPNPSSDVSQSHHELQLKTCEVQHKQLGPPEQKLHKTTVAYVDNNPTSVDGVWDVDCKDQVLTQLSVSVASGYTLLRNPHLNKGLAFTEKERDAHYLHGLLPPTVISQDTQVKKMIQYIRQYQVPLQKYMAMMDLQARNERLFYKLLIDHIEELLPVVYTPTVGEAYQKYGSIFMHPQGLYISLKVKGRILEVLKNWPQKSIQVIVVTDGERILGLGDLGCQSMGIAMRKLSLFTALGGVHPSSCLPVTIDVGTNNEKLLNDESYMGLKHRRATGQEYDELLHEFMTAVKQNFGEKVLVQFEDFSNHNAFDLIENYRSTHLVFNDDIQGTAPVVLAGLVAALKLAGGSLADHKFLFLGAGESGIGIAELVAWKTSKQTNAPLNEVRKNIWLVDSKGLIVSSRKESLKRFKKRWAHEHEPVEELVDAIRQLKPTVLIGTSGQGRSFTKEVIEAMAAISEKPIILALSNPISQSECTAEEAYTWSQGRAIFASGSPFDPVEYNGKVFVPGQANNAYIFPGFGLGLIMCGATRVYGDLLLAAADALAAEVTQENLDKGFIYPPITNIRKISAHIAASVAAKAYELGLATSLPRPKDLVKFAESCMYNPSL